MLLTAYTVANVFLLGIYHQFSDLVWKDAWLLTDQINQVSSNRKHDQLRLGEKNIGLKTKNNNSRNRRRFLHPPLRRIQNHIAVALWLLRRVPGFPPRGNQSKR